MPDRPRLAVHAAGDAAVRVLRPVILGEQGLEPTLQALSNEIVARPDSVTLFLPLHQPIRWGCAGQSLECRPGEGLLVDLSAGGATVDDIVHDGLALILPRQLVLGLIAGEGTGFVLAGSAALNALQRLATNVLEPGMALSQRQAQLVGRALGELLAAALSPFTADGLNALRQASLLDRVIAYVDRHLAEPLEPARLCRSLSCSRSALYRAVAPAGGIASLVNRRRLAAVHARLSNPHEGTAVAVLAYAHGFADAAHFSRSFKRRYGLTPRAIRQAAQAASLP